MVLNIYDQIGIVLKSLSVFCGLYFLFEGQWVCVIILLPIFFIDMYMGHNKNTAAMSKILMFFLLFQSLLCWYFFSSNIWDMPQTLPIDNTMVLDQFYHTGKGSSFVEGSLIPDAATASFTTASKSMKDVIRQKRGLEDTGLKAAPDMDAHKLGGASSSIGSSSGSVKKHVSSVTESGSAVAAQNSKHHTAAAGDGEDNGLIWSAKLESFDTQHIPKASQELIVKIAGRLPAIDFPDLKYRPRAEIQAALPRVFSELPEAWDDRFRNPCWMAEGTEEFAQPQSMGGRGRGRGNPSGGTSSRGAVPRGGPQLACLPYAYILGMPKCGTSDIFERMKGHDRIKMPERKEVRWFTRGEFGRSKIPHEGTSEEQEMFTGWDGPNEKLYGPGTSIFQFTSSFGSATKFIESSANQENGIVTIDGGPHTLWWPTQQPDGTMLPADIPPAQLLRELQPDTKFIITLSDPVKRMYSDYYFLDDNLTPVRPGAINSKSADQFHSRVMTQIEFFDKCIEDHQVDMARNNPRVVASARGTAEGKEREFPMWFRAAQMCAHDRFRFGAGGWGRINIGLYVLYIEKWLEHFTPEQFYVVRLEDYNNDPQAYMEGVFNFLELEEPKSWTKILTDMHFNEAMNPREPLHEETETALREFYRPYNELLAEMMENEGFLWQLPKDPETGVVETLRMHQLASEEKNKNKPSSRRDRSMNMHSMDRHDQFASAEHDPFHPSNDADSSSSSGGGGPGLRGGGSSSLPLAPEAFKIDGLRMEDPGYKGTSSGRLRSFDDKIPDPNIDWNMGNAAQQLCKSSFGMDAPALKYLLYDTGIPSDLISRGMDGNRNAFHCLSLIGSMADAQPLSHVFAELKHMGPKGWLYNLMDPQLPPGMDSVAGQEIVDAIMPSVVATARWLQAAGTPPDAQDTGGNTPLHHACTGGLTGLIEVLIEMGADVNIVNKERRPAITVCLAYGQAEAAGLLLHKGQADMTIKDKYGVTPMDLASSPGAITAADAQKYLNVNQRAAKQIERIIHPELKPDDPLGWVGGTGGWHTARLKGFEDDMGCANVDQYFIDELTSDILFNHFARNAPILIRGALVDWGVVQNYERETLYAEHSDMEVEVSSIPYAAKFGGEGSIGMTLGEYMDQVQEHRMVGGAHPWYVFQANPVPQESESPDSLVRYEFCPTPEALIQGFAKISGKRVTPGKQSRSLFVNAQWGLGGEGTGAPVHFHNTAWNAVVYGAKKWALYSPRNKIMSNKQILDYFETDLLEYEQKGFPAVHCVQTAGDILIVPESWGHGVLNLQETVAIASESKEALWRLKPNSALFAQFPSFDGQVMPGRGGPGGRGRGPPGGGRGPPPGGGGSPYGPPPGGGRYGVPPYGPPPGGGRYGPPPGGQFGGGPDSGGPFSYMRRPARDF